MSPMELAEGRPESASAVETGWGGSLRLRNVLCAVDLSEVSRRALRTASRIAAHFGARLYVQHTFALPQGAARVRAGESLREDLPPRSRSKRLSCVPW